MGRPRAPVRQGSSRPQPASSLGPHQVLAKGTLVLHEPPALLQLIFEHLAIREYNPATPSAISRGTRNLLLLLRPCTIVSDAGTPPGDHQPTKWTTPPALRVTSPGKRAY